MAKKNQGNELILPAEIVNDETGEIMNSADMETRLVFFEQQIAFGCIQIALALKTIRDERLYLARCSSIKEYIEEYIPISLRHAERHLQIADAFNSKALEKFKNTPLTVLLEISRNGDLLEEANDPDIDADDVIKKVRDQEKRKFEKKLDKNREVIQGQEALLEDLRERVGEKETEIARLKWTIQDLIAKKDVDPSKVVFVTQKKEAFGVIDESMVQILDSLGTLNNIPYELLDAELSGKLSQCISAIEAGVRRLKDFYSSYVITPADSAGLVPGE